MRNHDTPTYHQMLKLGLSLGVLHVLCAPALAESSLTEFIEQDAEKEAPKRPHKHAHSKYSNKRFDQAAPKTDRPDRQLARGLHGEAGNAQTGSTLIVESPTFSGSRTRIKTQTDTLSSANQRLTAATTNATQIDEQPQAVDEFSEAWSIQSLGDQTSEQEIGEQGANQQSLSATSASTLSALNTAPLDLSWQDVELTDAERWFSSLSIDLSDGISDEEFKNESSIAESSVEPAPTLEHWPAFTQVTEKQAIADVEENSEQLTEQRLTEDHFLTLNPVSTAQTEALDSGIIQADENESRNESRLEISPNTRLDSLRAGILTPSPDSKTQLAQASPEVSSPEVSSPEVIGVVEENATLRDTISTESDTFEPERLGRDLLSEILANQGIEPEIYPVLDDELGTLRLVQLRARENEELGILRILQTAQAVPPPPPAPILYLGGRLGFVDVDNVFRTVDRFSEQVYQAGLSLQLVPKLSENTSIYAIAETNIARYNNFSQVNYNEVQVQLGLRQKLLPRTFAQIGWRNQRLYSPGYRDKLFGVQYIDALVSHRRILSPKTWVDGFYQMRLGFADPQEASRFRQTFTVSFNYGISQSLRTSLLYQLDFDDYTQINRYDTYQQLLGIVSYNITPESRLSVFGGTRFGRSSEADINLDDTFYGAGLNVNLPLF